MTNELNRLASWLPMLGEDIHVKTYSEDYPYIKNGIVHKSTSLVPVVRYAKNYTIEGRKISLCIITTDKNVADVESWMDVQAADMKLSEVKKPFTLLERRYKY